MVNKKADRLKLKKIKILSTVIDWDSLKTFYGHFDTLQDWFGCLKDGIETSHGEAYSSKKQNKPSNKKMKNI